MLTRLHRMIAMNGVMNSDFTMDNDMNGDFSHE